MSTIEPAQKLFQKVLEIEALEDLCILARSGLRMWPESSRPEGRGWMWSFTWTQEITFEISMLGKYGLDISYPEATHPAIAAVRGFSALQFLRIIHPSGS